MGGFSYWLEVQRGEYTFLMLTKRQQAWLSIIIISAVFLGFVAILWFSPLRGLLSSPEELRSTVKSFGWAAPAIIIVMQFLQVIIAPIPGQAIDLANGYLFGWWWGSVISMAGLGLGTIAAILLAKRFGRPLVAALITPKGLKNITGYTHRRNQWLFFFLFLLPGTPDDLLCFAIGLSSIPARRAIAIALVGRTPGVVATVVAGSVGRSLNPLEFSLLAVLASLIILLVIWKTPLGKAMKVPDHLDGTSD